MAIKNATATNAAMPLGFNRGNPIPLDASSVYATLAEAKAYAKDGAVAYVGQIIAVNEGESSKAYIIADEAGTLNEVGSVVTETDILDALGFEDAANGAQLVKGTDGQVSWVVPSTETVEGLQTAVSTLQADVTKLNGGETVEGSVAYQIAQIVNESDNGKIDTLKEIANWIVNDTTGAAKMASDINDNANAISALEGLVGDTAVATQISDAITAALKDGDNNKYALASELTTLSELVGTTSVADQIKNTIEDSEGNSKFAPFTHIHVISDISGLSATLNEKAKQDDLDSAIERIEALESTHTNKTILDAITQDKVDAWDGAIQKIIAGTTELTKNNGSVTIPAATASALGLVQVDDDTIQVDTNGIIGVKAVDVSKIYIKDGDSLILNGGTAN